MRNKGLSKQMRKEIIEKNLSAINLVVNKSYLNNSFAIEITNEKDIKEFEKVFASSLARSINSYLEENKIDTKSINRSLTYVVNNTKNNVIINF